MLHLADVLWLVNGPVDGSGSLELVADKLLSRSHGIHLHELCLVLLHRLDRGRVEKELLVVSGLGSRRLAERLEL